MTYCVGVGLPAAGAAAATASVRFGAQPTTSAALGSVPATGSAARVDSEDADEDDDDDNASGDDGEDTREVEEPGPSNVAHAARKGPAKATATSKAGSEAWIGLANSSQLLLFSEKVVHAGTFCGVQAAVVHVRVAAVVQVTVSHANAAVLVSRVFVVLGLCSGGARRGSGVTAASCRRW